MFLFRICFVSHVRPAEAYSLLMHIYTLCKIISLGDLQWVNDIVAFCSPRRPVRHSNYIFAIGFTGWGLSFELWRTLAECKPINQPSSIVCFNAFLRPVQTFNNACSSSHWSGEKQGFLPTGNHATAKFCMLNQFRSANIWWFYAHRIFQVMSL